MDPTALDALCHKVKELVPEADFILVGRELILGASDEPSWALTFDMPKRNKAFKVMKHRTERISVNGQTVEQLLDRAVAHARYQRTGSFE